MQQTDELSPPSRQDPLVRDATTVIGGPAGKHTRFGGATFWTPVRVLVALGMLTFTLGWAAKTPCSNNQWVEHYQYTRLCYSDVYALFFAEGLDQEKVPYRDHPVEYPAVIGFAMWGANIPSDNAEDFFNVTAAGLLVCAVGVIVLTSWTAGRRRPWDAALVALAPGLLFHGTTNWDLISAVFLALAMWAWARRQPALAGLWVGLGTASKLYPGFLLLALLFLCFRAKRMREWWQAVAAALGSFVVVYLPIVMASGTFPLDHCEKGLVMEPAWQRFFSLNRCRPADWDSLAFVYQHFTGDFLGHRELNNITMALVLAVFAGVGILTLTAPRRPRVAQVMFLLVAGFLLVNKVNSPQYTIWLIPLAALARPRWGAFLAWQLSEFLVMFTRFYFFINQGTKQQDGIDGDWFVGAVLLRNALLVVLISLVIREMYRPYHDVVRRDGEDDPAGGVLDGALDRSEVVVGGDDEWTMPREGGVAPWPA